MHVERSTGAPEARHAVCAASVQAERKAFYVVVVADTVARGRATTTTERS